MDQRKLIKFGSNSFVISLPKQWITKQGLGKGDPIYLKERGDSLSIITQPGHTPPSIKEIRIDGTEALETIKLKILTSYINNHKRIVILKPGDNIEDIRSILHGIIALEIIEQSPQIIVAQDYLDMTNISLRELTKQIDTILRGMLNDLNNSVANRNKGSSSQEIAQRDLDINRLTLLALRTIRFRFTRGDENPLNLMKAWEAIYTLEKTGDEVKRLARLTHKTKMNDYPELIYLLKDFEQLFQELMELFYLKDIEGAYTLAAKKTARRKRIQELHKKYYGDIAVSSIILRIQTMGQNFQTLLRTIYE